jgi:hypothetical protein
MRQAPPTSTIEKFRRQRQRLKKHLLAFLIILAMMITVPLVLGSFPALRNHPDWKIFGNAWICLFASIFVALGIAASFHQMCPACSKSLGRSFSIVRYCPHCGTKLAED